MSTKEISKLAKMLEGMKPVEAAAIAERLPDETIVQLVLRMKSRAGAKMMAALPVPIAASVAARMAELSGVGG
jgi:flagellar motility protein MotE (MotC chaperone)